MLLNILAYIFAVRIQGVLSVKTNEKCYEVASSPGSYFPIFFDSEMTFIPKFLYMDFEIHDNMKFNDLFHSKRFDARLVDRECSTSPLVFPNVISKDTQIAKMIIRIFYANYELMIERFEAYVSADYKDITTKIQGLNGIADLPVHFSPTDKRFQPFHLMGISFMSPQSQLKKSKEICLRVMKKGKPIIFKIRGETLIQQTLYDYYIFKISIDRPHSFPEVSEVYLAEASACPKRNSLEKQYISTDSSTEKIRFQAKDEHGRQYLTADFVRSDNTFELDESSSNIKVKNVEIKTELVQDALKMTDHILLYPFKETIKHCPMKGYYSYVKISKSKETEIKLFSYMTDPYNHENKIFKIRQGTDEETEMCLNEKAS